MIGIVLGLGFQWWPDLKEPWQYIAFIFAYLSIVDYWVDTSAALKKYPPKKELDLILDIGIMFTLFLLIYASLKTVPYLLTTFVVFRTFDSLWIIRRTHEHADMADKHIFNVWLKFNTIEALLAIVLIVLSLSHLLPPLSALLIFIILRIVSRVATSFRYKKVYFV